MMKKFGKNIGIALFVMFFAVTVKALDLTGVAAQADATEAASAELTKSLAVIVDALAPSNLIKASWIGVNGKMGAEAMPKVFVEGNTAIVSIGIKLEIDREKYTKEVFEPLKAVLDKYAKPQDTIKIPKSKVPFEFKLCDDREIIAQDILVDGYSYDDDVKVITSLAPKNSAFLNVNMAGGSKLFDSRGNGYVYLYKPSKNGLELLTYFIGDTVVEEAFQNLHKQYVERYADAKIHIECIDEDKDEITATDIAFDTTPHGYKDGGMFRNTCIAFLSGRKKFGGAKLFSQLFAINHPCPGKKEPLWDENKMNTDDFLMVPEMLRSAYMEVPKSSLAQIKDIKVTIQNK